MTQAADPAAVYALNQALIQVMERGTGRSVRAQLPDDLVVAGKTGTSDDLRDSWFAGFTNDHLIVAWLGADDNRPIGLTGSTGAAKIWAGVLSSVEANSYDAPQPDGVDEHWIDYVTGNPTVARCPDAIPVPVPDTDYYPRVFGCNGETGLGARIRSWLGGDDQ
jgi:penicillin-binding protein 1B